MDQARQAQLMARTLRTVPLDEIERRPAPIEGVTEDEELVPPGPLLTPADDPRPDLEERPEGERKDEDSDDPAGEDDDEKEADEEDEDEGEQSD